MNQSESTFTQRHPGKVGRWLFSNLCLEDQKLSFHSDPLLNPPTIISMQCQRRLLCRAPHAYSVSEALVNTLTSACSRRWQTTIPLVEKEYVRDDGEDTSSEPDLSHLALHTGRRKPNWAVERNASPSRGKRVIEHNGFKSAPQARAVEKAALGYTGAKDSPALGADMTKVLGPYLCRQIMGLPMRNLLGSSWTAQMQVIAQTINRLQNRRDGKPVHDVPQQVRDYIDYEGHALMPRKPRGVTTTTPQWELSLAECAGKNGFERLDEELKAFVAHMETTPTETAARKAVIEEVLQLMHRDQSLGSFQTELYGSEKTGLALATSDIDIRLYRTESPQEESPCRRTKGSTLKGAMKHLLGQMVASGRYESVVLRTSATYPIIHAKHVASSLEIQLVASDSSALRESLVKRALEDIPHLRTLYLVVRTILSARGLIDVFNGGLGSYATFMWVSGVARSQLFKQNVQNNGYDSPASHLVAFLRFVAGMNVGKYAFAVYPAGILLKHDLQGEAMQRRLSEILTYTPGQAQKELYANQLKITFRSPLQPYKLCIQDPADSSNDLGRKCHAFKHIRYSIGTAHQRLTKTMDAMTEYTKAGKPPWQHVLLDCMIGRPDVFQQVLRTPLKRYGQQVLAQRRPEERRTEFHASEAVNISGPGRLYA